MEEQPTETGIGLASEEQGRWNRLVNRVAPIASKIGFIAALANDWSNFGALTIANVSAGAYDHVGSWAGVGAGAFIGGTIGFAEQYLSARCANTVANSVYNTKSFKWVRAGYVGRKLGVEEGEPYRRMGLAATSITGFTMGDTAVVLKERLLGGATHQDGKRASLRAAGIFGVTVGALAGAVVGSSEIAHLLGSEYTAGLIKDVSKNKLIWGGAAVLTILGGVYSAFHEKSADLSGPVS